MLNKLNPRPFVEIHPEDAAALGIRDKDWVEVRSRRGRAVLPAAVTDRVRPGNCFAPFHWNDLFGENLAINAVTSDAIDPISLQPEFKFCAVALTRVAPRALLRPPVREERALSPPAAALTAASSSILVLWASSTGNAEGFAARCAERLTAQGHCVALAGMAGFNVAALNAARRVLLVVSTFGDGDPLTTAPPSGRRYRRRTRPNWISWRFPCWRWAMRTMTSFAVSAAGSMRDWRRWAPGGCRRGLTVTPTIRTPPKPGWIRLSRRWRAPGWLLPRRR